MSDARIIATAIEEIRHCNCDLDNWVPEQLTGHSWVCRIHKLTMTYLLRPNDISDKLKNEIQAILEALLKQEHEL